MKTIAPHLVCQSAHSFLTRRRFMQRMAGVLPAATLASAAYSANIKAGHGAQVSQSDAAVGSAPKTNNPNVAYGATTLPVGIRSRFVNNSNGLTMHVLETGFNDKDRPCILLLHGFPELAYSWRKIMPLLAAAGYYVVAPDQRGYGRTTGWDDNYDGDLDSYRTLNLVRDVVGLVSALGLRSVATVVGHDFGSPVAAWSALIRPDIFRSVVLMSGPFGGPPALPFNTDVSPAPGKVAAKNADVASPRDRLDEALAALKPPRKRYSRYYTTQEANENMWHAPQGVHNFLRAYFHYKSADWKPNKPHLLKSGSAAEYAQLPTYYVMERDKGMAETVAPMMPTTAQIAACRWLPEEELRVFSEEYSRLGFQGGLQWYRCASAAKYRPELQLFAGRTIDVPACFIAGAADWGAYQSPGLLEKMKASACTRLKGVYFIENAGHWVQQEQPEKTADHLLNFLKS